MLLFRDNAQRNTFPKRTYTQSRFLMLATKISGTTPVTTGLYDYNYYSLGRVRCADSPDSDSLSLSLSLSLFCLDMWYVLPMRDDVADLGLPGPRRIPVATPTAAATFLPFPTTLLFLSLSLPPLSLFLSLSFSKNQSSSRFVSVMRRLLARALKQKRGRTICRIERGGHARLVVCACERARARVRKRDGGAAAMEEKSIRKCDRGIVF